MGVLKGAGLTVDEIYPVAADARLQRSESCCCAGVPQSGEPRPNVVGTWQAPTLVFGSVEEEGSNDRANAYWWFRDEARACQEDCSEGH